MIEYKCPRCMFKTSRVDNFRKHLRREKPCDDVQACNKTQHEIECELDDNLQQVCCKRCHKAYANHRFLAMHMKYCDMLDCGENEEIHDKTPTIDNTTTTNNTNCHNVTTTTTNTNCNNVTNNNIHHHYHHVAINNFGEEDVSYITDDVMMNCVNTMKVAGLIDRIYFDKNHPENHTIRLESEKKGHVGLHKNGHWIVSDMNSSIDNIIETQNEHLNRFFYAKVMPDESIEIERRVYAQGKLAYVNDRNSRFYDQRRQVRARLKEQARAKLKEE
jgi:hypothetical protein